MRYRQCRTYQNRHFHSSVSGNLTASNSVTANMREEEVTITEGLSYFEDPEDEYSCLPVTPDGQGDPREVQPQVNPNLGMEQQAALQELIHKFDDIFSEIP
ncbi:hypothetical protein Pcinc_006924 [Petrolisthes cinctipes]|uniref:Uncharacterized protein n=1 Tax=Petrolisthes cinctipes TaxID=88211 RepID=A0AAE1G9I0_PETCI|nr:hypothetical protein Pcinc_006924 [Petrolisthes cinctipes]